VLFSFTPPKKNPKDRPNKAAIKGLERLRDRARGSTCVSSIPKPCSQANLDRKGKGGTCLSSLPEPVPIESRSLINQGIVYHIPTHPIPPILRIPKGPSEDEGTHMFE